MGTQRGHRLARAVRHRSPPTARSSTEQRTVTLQGLWDRVEQGEWELLRNTAIHIGHKGLWKKKRRIRSTDSHRDSSPETWAYNERDTDACTESTVGCTPGAKRRLSSTHSPPISSLVIQIGWTALILYCPFPDANTQKRINASHGGANNRHERTGNRTVYPTDKGTRCK